MFGSSTATATHAYDALGPFTIHVFAADEDFNTGTDFVLNNAFSASHQVNIGVNARVRVTYTNSAVVDSAATPLTVTNTDPSLTLNTVSAINENGVAILTGTILEPSAVDTFTLTVNWGDPASPNNVETFNLSATSNGIRTFSLTHQYLDDDPTSTAVDNYTINVTVMDDDGPGIAAASETVTVNNVAPNGGLNPVTAINENGTATLTGTVIDPGTQDTFTLTVNWGDPLSPDNVETITLPASATGSQTFSLTHQYLDDNPTATAQDEYQINVTVMDDDGDSVSLGSLSEFIVNGGFETGDFTGWTVVNSAAINWSINDGTFVPQGGFSGELAPISGNFDAITSQNTGGVHYLSQEFVVPSNVAFATLSWLDRIRNYNDGFVDQAQEFRVLLLDGGGTRIQEIFVTNPGDPRQQIGPNSRSFDLTSLFSSLAGQLARISFQQEQTFHFFNTTLDDVSLQVATTDPTTVLVKNVDPTLVLNSMATINENGVATLTGTITDAGTRDTFTMDVTWGDGTQETIALGAGTTEFTVGHTYVDDPNGAANQYTINAVLTDDDGGSDSASTIVTVNNQAPTIDAIAVTTPSSFEGSLVTVVGSIADVGVEDVHTVSVTWGDGSTSAATVDQATHTFTATHTYEDDDPTGTPADDYTSRPQPPMMMVIRDRVRPPRSQSTT